MQTKVLTVYCKLLYWSAGFNADIKKPQVWQGDFCNLTLISRSVSHVLCTEVRANQRQKNPQTLHNDYQQAVVCGTER